MTLTLTDIDRELARYRGAADTVSANLLELERDPNRQLLDTAPIIGATADAWADARTALGAIWDWFARFTTFLDQASALRDSPRARLTPAREQQLADLMTQPSIELTNDEIPLRDRQLLQQRQSTTRCTADELLQLMSDAFQRAKDTVVAIGTAWDELTPRLAAVRAALPNLAGVDLAAVERHADALGEKLVTDPLAVTDDAIRELERQVSGVVQAAAAARQLRDGFGSRLERARAELRTAENHLRDARAAYDTARAKILDPVIPDLPVLGPELARELARIGALADRAAWRDADDALAHWMQSVVAFGEAADASAMASRSCIASRDELRGRLDAYRAKAHALGLDEDPELTRLHEAAQAALYTAPTDLGDASERVARYQRALSANHEPEARR